MILAAKRRYAQSFRGTRAATRDHFTKKKKKKKKAELRYRETEE